MVGKLKIFVVMPAYNESAHIADVIRRMPFIVDRVIVVDDCSSDGTGDVARSTGDSRVDLIRNSKNLGVGGAVVAGYRSAFEAGADIVVKLDADGQMDPLAIDKLVRPIVQGTADYAKGFRFHSGQSLRRMPKVRLIGNLGLSYLVKMASGYWNIFDPTNGFTAIHREALAMINLDKLDKGYFFETDMLCSLYRIRAVVKDVCLFTHYADEISKLNPFNALIRFPPKLLCAYMRRVVWHYYIRDFSVFSILFFAGWLLVIFGLIFGAIKWHQSTSGGVTTPTGTVMFAVVPLFLGFQMLLQAALLDVGSVPTEPLQRLCDRNWQM